MTAPAHRRGPDPAQHPAGPPRRTHRRRTGCGVAAVLAALVVAGACSSDGELMDLDRADGSTVPRTPASGAPGSSTAPTTTAGSTAGPDPADGTTTPPGAAIDLGSTCTWALADATIRYPTGWHTPEPGSTGSCVLFDPAPVTVPVDSEAPLVAVAASYDDRALDSAAAATFDPLYWSVLDEQRTTFDSRPGGCWHVVATGQGLDEIGTNMITCLVQLDGRTIGFSTMWAADGDDPGVEPTLRAMASAITDA